MDRVENSVEVLSEYGWGVVDAIGSTTIAALSSKIEVWGFLREAMAGRSFFAAAERQRLDLSCCKFNSDCVPFCLGI